MKTPITKKDGRAAKSETPGARVSRPHHQPPQRRGGRMTDSRRQEVMSKAAALFIQKGYDNVSIDDVIKLVGGSKATIYAQFGGKRGLFEAVIRQPCFEVTHAIKINPTGDIEDQLIQIGRAFLSMVLSPHVLELHRLMVSIGKTFPAVSALFYEKGPLTAYDILAQWIEKQQAAGRLGPGNPRRLAILFHDMLIGDHQLALLTSPKHCSPKAIDKTVRDAVALFLNGARAEGKESARLRSKTP